MNRRLWQATLTDAYCPAWHCPVCRRGTLSLVKDSLVHAETAESKRQHGHEEWDPEFIVYTFTAWAECKYPSCKQRFAISGNGGVTQDYDDQDGPTWVDFFSPKACHPMPELFELPSKCPEEIADELRAAFSLFWSQRPACAGRLRVALELVMDHVGMPRRRKNKHGKLAELDLHPRIELFAKRDPTIGPNLMALKWLGNTGSHVGDVGVEDLLDAFEIMEHSLGEIIERRTKHVAKLAKTLARKYRR